MAKRQASTQRSNGADSAPAQTRAVAAQAASLQEGWVGMTRDQLEVLMQSTSAWLRGIEAVRKVQLDMTHLAAEQHQELAQRLRAVRDLPDLIALEVEMMRFDSAAAMRSTQELYDATLRSANQAFESARTAVDANHNDGLKAWMQSFQSMSHTGVKPFDDLFGHWLKPLVAIAEGERNAAH
jgi:hypothetical protein